jgi:hypothetical protein
MFDERGQTTQDYVLGVSIMLVTTLFIFGYLPGLYDSYQSPITSVEDSQADRAAASLIENYSVDGNESRLKFDEDGGIDRVLSRSSGFAAFRADASLNTSTDRIAKPNVNVVLVGNTSIHRSGRLVPIEHDADGDGTAESLEYGDSLDEDTPTASTTRIVTLNETSTNYCDPTCWLVVRVW